MINMKLKKIIILVCLFLMAITFNAKCYAIKIVASGDAKTSNYKVNTKSWEETLSYKHPYDNDIINQKGAISWCVGLFCCWFAGNHSDANAPWWGVKKAEAFPCGERMNNWSYIMALDDQNTIEANKTHPTANSWKKGIPQNFIWWMEKNRRDGSEYDFAKIMGIGDFLKDCYRPYERQYNYVKFRMI